MAGQAGRDSEFGVWLIPLRVTVPDFRRTLCPCKGAWMILGITDDTSNLLQKWPSHGHFCSCKKHDSPPHSIDPARAENVSCFEPAQASDGSSPVRSNSLKKKVKFGLIQIVDTNDGQRTIKDFIDENAFRTEMARIRIDIKKEQLSSLVSKLLLLVSLSSSILWIFSNLGVI